jgi:hypothetical protein
MAAFVLGKALRIETNFLANRTDELWFLFTNQKLMAHQLVMAVERRLASVTFVSQVISFVCRLIGHLHAALMGHSILLEHEHFLTFVARVELFENFVGVNGFEVLVQINEGDESKATIWTVV